VLCFYDFTLINQVLAKDFNQEENKKNLAQLSPAAGRGIGSRPRLVVEVSHS
jgi:hypothetical protein